MLKRGAFVLEETMEKFNKKSLTSEEQIELLQQRGLSFQNKSDAIEIIKRIGYYHLSSYMRLFQSGQEHLFMPGTEFSQILNVYNFDKDLRHLTFNAIEKIEIAYKASLINILCKEFGSHWFYESEIFINKSIKNELGKIETQQEHILRLIEREIKKKKKKENEYAETFICKYYEKYSEPLLPPFWMIAETLSIGSLHRFYYSLIDKYKRQIISYLGFKEDVTFIAIYSNWLQPICMVRNICAHHSRLFNRKFRIKAKQHKQILEFTGIPNNNFYYIAMIINYYLKTMLLDVSFEQDIINLFQKYPSINKDLLGFPNNWTNFNITRLQKHQLSKKIKP